MELRYCSHCHCWYYAIANDRNSSFDIILVDISTFKIQENCASVGTQTMTTEAKEEK